MVPRVLNKIHDKIIAGMAAKGGLTEKMFNMALEAKTLGLAEGRLTVRWSLMFHCFGILDRMIVI